MVDVALVWANRPDQEYRFMYCHYLLSIVLGGWRKEDREGWVGVPPLLEVSPR